MCVTIYNIIDLYTYMYYIYMCEYNLLMIMRSLYPLIKVVYACSHAVYDSQGIVCYL
jgi:hypothetical protein